MKDTTSPATVCEVLSGGRGTIMWEPPTSTKEHLETSSAAEQALFRQSFAPALQMFSLTLAGITCSGAEIGVSTMESLLNHLAAVNEEALVLLQAAKRVTNMPLDQMNS
jgi:hypothetical protein